MANSEVSGMESKSTRRGRPAKSKQAEFNTGSNIGSEPQADRGKSNRPKRDIFKVFSIRVTDDIEACVVRHNTETIHVLLNVGATEWKSLHDKESVFYRMIERAARGRKGGARLVGIYYDANMALLPNQLPPVFVTNHEK